MSNEIAKKANLRIINLWLKNLMSGEYTQGKNSLRQTAPNVDMAQYCCLGVLCDIIRPTFDAHWNTHSFLFKGEGNLDYLPYELAPYVGLTQYGAKPSGVAWTIGGSTYPSLSKANDDRASFKQIAEALYDYYRYTINVIPRDVYYLPLEEYLQRVDTSGNITQTRE